MQAPLAQYLPPGYTLARNVIPAAPGAPSSRAAPTPTPTVSSRSPGNRRQAATAPSYTLEHKNAGGGWSTVASGLTSTEYTFGSGNPEGEGTWTYRVTECNEGSPANRRRL